MKWIYRERVKGSKRDEIRLGIASWDKGDGKSRSIKYTWFDKLNRACRGGEVPIETLPQMIAFAKKNGYL